ncbi:MAG TPA: cytochrome c biogenesis protein CcsA [Parachlamydiaceae bacterium]|nr:cytochrome c biogenesis protein CcsA [Parachlamydiaceae bacterium]
MLNSFLSLFVLAILTCTNVCAESQFEPTKDLPVSYQGRFRSLESASRLWLYDIYHRQQLKKNDLQLFDAKDASAMDLLWQIHFFGHQAWDESPFFWVHYATVKSLLKLESKDDHFSYNRLYHSLNENEETNLPAVKILILHEFAKQYRASTNRAQRNKIELQNLSHGLWVTLANDTLVVAKAPAIAPWNFLKSGMTITDNAEETLQQIVKTEKNTADELTQLLLQLQAFSEYNGSPKQSQKAFEDFSEELAKRGILSSEIAQTLETRFPFNQRLQTAGTTLKMLPAKFSPGEWVSLHAFKTKIYDQNLKQLVPAGNFTSFSDEHFHQLRKSYFELERHVLLGSDGDQIEIAVDSFASDYHSAYENLGGTAYRQAKGKALTYPIPARLEAETLYYRLPLIEFTLIAYAIALILMLVQSKKPKLGSLTLLALLFGFFIHTAVLIFRCFILERPPVSNMFETVVYVPWIAVALGLAFYFTTRSRIVIAAAVLASFALLVLLRLTQVDSRLENVQAVLDSQYWLIIHVLMIVASYGAFVVCGILGHFYLLNYAFNRGKTLTSDKIARGILHTMYVGVALLIPGTILGGVWAAESWGRFWDWDPKESWAFISACVYILFIHAYTFHYIRDFGLAIGSIAGLLAISFTWYGVNYVLGTGFHSYGFGSGGESLYFLFVAAECLFIIFMAIFRKQIRRQESH